MAAYCLIRGVDASFIEARVYNSSVPRFIRDSRWRVLHCEVFQGKAPMAKILCFECTKCREQLTADVARNVCPKDGGPLYVRYDLASVRDEVTRESVGDGPASMWRYSAVLPDVEPVTLGEGLTPLLPSRRYRNLLIKDEGLNPTGSFKARGMSVAVTMARHYGLKKLAAPSAGNAGGALAVYAAAAQI